jgi:hypothetical protein
MTSLITSDTKSSQKSQSIIETELWRKSPLKEKIQSLETIHLKKTSYKIVNQNVETKEIAGEFEKSVKLVDCLSNFENG